MAADSMGGDPFREDCKRLLLEVACSVFGLGAKLAGIELICCQASREFSRAGTDQSEFSCVCIDQSSAARPLPVSSFHSFSSRASSLFSSSSLTGDEKPEDVRPCSVPSSSSCSPSSVQLLFLLLTAQLFLVFSSLVASVDKLAKRGMRGGLSEDVIGRSSRRGETAGLRA